MKKAVDPRNNGARPSAINNPPKMERISETPRTLVEDRPVNPYTDDGFTNANNPVSIVRIAAIT